MPDEPRTLRLFPALRARPRLAGSILFGIAIYALVTLLSEAPTAARVLVGWNAGASLYLLLSWQMTRGTDVETIRRRAVSQDEGRFAILTVVVLAGAAILLAVGSQLAQAHDLHGKERIEHVALAVLTVMTSWLFTQVVFALHYAHDFYLARIRGAPDPLAFPGTRDPGYVDFLHFACIIGTAGQTADIAFNGSALRPVGTVHCIVAFFFNASLLALSINVVASVLLPG